MNFWKKLFSSTEIGSKKLKKAPRGRYPKNVGVSPKVVDLRSDEEQLMEKDAIAGKSLGPEVDRLVTIAGVMGLINTLVRLLV